VKVTRMGDARLSRTVAVGGGPLPCPFMVVAPSLNNTDYYSSNNKLHGLSPRANYTDRATAASRRSDCQLFADKGCHVVIVTDPYGRILSVF
jgi:hypothetical protein